MSSIDGAGHQVQIYTDISAGELFLIHQHGKQLTHETEWVAGDHSSIAQWDYGVTTDNVAYHKVYRQTQLAFSETSDQADWGNVYYSTKNSLNLAYQSGPDSVVRQQFLKNGTLTNTKDTNYRPISQDWPVFGYSSDFGTVQRETHSTLYTIGIAQKQAIQFDGTTGIIPLSSLWTSYFATEEDSVSAQTALGIAIN